MSIPWNSTLRDNVWSNWNCSINGAAASCPSGYRADTSQFKAAGDCGDGNKGNSTPGGCPNSCNADTRSVCLPGWLGGSCSYTPLYDRYSVDCFKNNYPTDDDSLWNCCSGATPAQNCDVNYYMGSPSCNNWLSTHCTGNILTNPSDPKYGICNSWCQNNQTQCNANKLTYCNNVNNLSNPNCQDFAINYGQMDSAVATYCAGANHLNDPFCSCQKPLVSYTGADPQLAILNNPVCFGAQCPINGYKTTDQRNFKCPSTLSICNNSINVSGKSSTYLSTLANTCTIKNTSPAPSAPSIPSTAPSTPSTGSSTGSSTTPSTFLDLSTMTPAYKFLLVFIIIISIVFGFSLIVYHPSPVNTNSIISTTSITST